MKLNQFPIKGRARSAYPGDQTYIMSRPAVSTDGKTFARGTEYTPLSAGHNNAVHGARLTQRVLIGGKVMVF